MLVSAQGKELLELVLLDDFLKELGRQHESPALESLRTDLVGDSLQFFRKNSAEERQA